MPSMKEQTIWFVVGSQAMYGPEVLETVAARGAEMAAFIDDCPHIPCRFVYKGTIKSAQEVTAVAKDANYDDNCCGVVTWAHTFSPSKMWINGLALLQKPWCHFATQYNRSIPDKQIDMDFMNLNQAAHGDREHGFIGARMRLPRKVVVGYWQDEEPLKELGEWMRAAVGRKVSRDLRVVRFGDNMREVAVTEGDKVEAQIKLGWQVNTWPVGELVEEIGKVIEDEVDALLDEYRGRYVIATDSIAAVRYQAKTEIAMERILVREGASAYSNTFQDLWGMEQLPGLASQRLMEKGYGYGAEGDWKTAAMTHIVKAMTQGLAGGSTFMEDYTYHFEQGNEYELGSHMLEVCPTIASAKPRIEVHPLGIGGKDGPARLVFEGHPGRRDHDLAGRHGRQASPDRAGYRVRETHLRDAESARCAGHVAPEVGSCRRHPSVDLRGRSASHGADLRRQRADVGGLGGHHGDRVRPPDRENACGRTEDPSRALRYVVAAEESLACWKCSKSRFWKPT